jgi:hypothetical protein
MEMLNAIIFEESGQFTVAVQHDLESFCWVALWAILKFISVAHMASIQVERKRAYIGS